MIEATLCSWVEAGVNQADHTLSKNYRTALRSLPPLVHSAGLLQAVAYCKAKDKSTTQGKGGAWALLMNQVMKALIRTGHYEASIGETDNLDAFELHLRACDQREYQQLTLRAMYFLSRMKSFVDGAEFAQAHVTGERP